MGSSVRRVVPPTEEQVAALADAMPGVLRAFTLTAAYSGLRLEVEVAALLAGDVAESSLRDLASLGLALADPGRAPLGGDSATCLLHVRSGKGPRKNGGVGKERWSVLFEPGLSALLESAHPYGHLFRNARGYPWTRKAVNKAWCRARADVGLEWVQFRDLRRFHASWLLDRGVSEMDVALQLGHTDRFGRPNTDQVRKTYGWPDSMKALARVAAAA